jgi:23S rRNA (cytosine1962-C5)-methyltransferase
MSAWLPNHPATTEASEAMKQLYLKPKEDRRLRQGHLWVFSNEVARHPEAEPGDVIEVITHGGESLGSALYHPHSLISARLLLTDVEELERDFFLQRISSAANLRSRLFPDQGCYRLVHGESDWLPGLVIDRYGDYLVVQATAAGMDRRLPLIADCLAQLFAPAGILEKDDTRLRSYEQLPERKSVLYGEDPGTVLIEEMGVQYRVNLLEGQKTGFFLDQKLNRAAAGRIANGLRVLDCFSNVGGFALHAAKGGASHVTAVEISAPAIEQARANAALNGFAQVSFHTGDAFDFLQNRLDQGERYDMVVLDPPSFARNRKTVGPARKGYRKLNQLGMQVLSEGGLLVTASCSFHIFEEVFYDLLSEAALRVDRRLKLLEWRHQSPDHPILPSMPETRYLKLGIFQVE